MPARRSESLILRTYPFREADLVVSFFTRDQGKLRGVARRARKPKSTFGSGLERLSHADVSYYMKENRELVNLNSCDLIHSQFALSSRYDAGLALDFVAEVSEHLLPPHEVNEKQFRLTLAVLEHLRSEGSIWAAVTYFLLWSVRLAGLLAELQLREDTMEIAQEMLVRPIAQLSPVEWTRETALDLRRALVRTVEEHVERRLLTSPMLESL